MKKKCAYSQMKSFTGKNHGAERLKLLKLIGRIQLLIFKLNESGGLPEHRHLKQAYYLEKIDRLKFFLLHMEVSQNSTLIKQLNQLYPALVRQWSQDVRWITNTQRLHASTKPIL